MCQRHVPTGMLVNIPASQPCYVILIGMPASIPVHVVSAPANRLVNTIEATCICLITCVRHRYLTLMLYSDSMYRQPKVGYGGKFGVVSQDTVLPPKKHENKKTQLFLQTLYERLCNQTTTGSPGAHSILHGSKSKKEMPNMVIVSFRS